MGAAGGLAPGLRWRWILPTGAGAAVLNWVLVYQSVFAYAGFFRFFGRNPTDAEIDAFAEAVVFWEPVFHLLLALFAARWVAARAGERFVAHGMLVGLVSVVVHQVIGLRYAPVDLGDVSRYLSMALIGGLLGALWGRSAQARREAVLRASRAIGEAETPREVAAAVGTNLAGPDAAAVLLWDALWDAPRDDARNAISAAELVPLAVWTPDGDVEAAGSWTGARPDPDLVSAVFGAGGTGERSPVVVRPEGLRGNGGEENAGSALVLPLSAPDGARAGLLAVVFRRRSRPSREVLLGYQTVAAQAALALENIRLVEEARSAGRETGMLGERQRLAHEIHDTLAQGFNGIVMHLETTERRLPPGADRARQPLNTALATARESLAEARRLVWALRPEALDRHSLPEALEMLVAKWSQETGVAGGFNLSGAERRLAPEIEAAVLRTAQETLSNVRKHAKAARVMLTLSYMKDAVVLDARDDGVGFDPGQVAGEVRDHDAGGFGLRAMRERICQLGGAVEVESEPGEGTSLAVQLPAEQPSERASSHAEPQPAGEPAGRA